MDKEKEKNGWKPYWNHRTAFPQKEYYTNTRTRAIPPFKLVILNFRYV